MKEQIGYRITSSKVDYKRFSNKTHQPQTRDWDQTNKPSLRLSSWSSRGIYFGLETTFDGRTYRFQLDRSMAEDLVESLTKALKDADAYNVENPAPKGYCFVCGMTSDHMNGCTQRAEKEEAVS